MQHRALILSALAFLVFASVASARTTPSGDIAADLSRSTPGTDGNLVPSTGNADFSEDFDSYATGTSLHGVNGWKGWDNNPGATAYNTDAQARSAPNSVDITSTSDLVHEFSGYSDGGPYNWSTDIQFANGLVTNDGDLATLPMITDAWVEIRIEIDLDADLQTIYYGGNYLTQTSWIEGMSGGGALNIAALDLYSNNACDVYYDDISTAGSIPGVPDPTQCSVDPWDAYGHAFVSPGTQSAADAVTITVLDPNGDPLAGAAVELDLGQCGDLCVDIPDGLAGMTNANGQLTLNPRVGGWKLCDVEVLAGGVVIRHYSEVRSVDWDGTVGNGGVTDLDVEFFQEAFLGTLDPAYTTTAMGFPVPLI